MITTFTAKLSLREIENLIKREVEILQPEFKVKSVEIEITKEYISSGFGSGDYQSTVNGATIILERK